ncbi:MAG: menaquinone biosynthesis protein [Saprospiraceae bacterium]|nr:menaquinone biosynthesis protein [Saprospiraceae bacterium]
MVPSTSIAIVNYLNTKPFIYGLNRSPFAAEFELHEIMPSRCAQWYMENKVDIALVPVGALPGPPDHLINAYGIASDGAVASVCLLSEVPIHEIKNLILDYQSRTSVTLVRILLDQFWQHRPVFLEGYEGFESRIAGATAGLVIGDRAIRLKNKFPFVYDLGQAWKELTGLPFVYAVWLKNGNLPDDKIRKFNAALQNGLEHIEVLLTEIQEYDPVFLKSYFNQNIKYHLKPEYLEGLNLFYKKRKQIETRPLVMNL